MSPRQRFCSTEEIPANNRLRSDAFIKTVSPTIYWSYIAWQKLTE